MYGIWGKATSRTLSWEMCGRAVLLSLLPIYITDANITDLPQLSVNIKGPPKTVVSPHVVKQESRRGLIFRELLITLFFTLLYVREK